MSFIGLLRIIEQITRPAGHDDDRPLPCDTGDCWYDAHGHVCPHHCFDGAEQLAEREAEEEVSEPAPVVCLSDGGRCECDRTSQGCIAYHTTETKLADLKADRGTGAISDGEPQLVTLSGREYERYLEGALNEPFVHVAEVCRAHQAEECWVCDEDDDALWVHPRDLGAERLAEREAEEDVSEPRQCQTHPRTGWELRTPGSATPHKVCNMCDSPIPGTDYNYCDYHRGAVFADFVDFVDTRNSTEPALTPDELVGVRGLLQERYGDRAGAYDRYWNAKTPADESSALDEIRANVIRANEEMLRVAFGEPPRTSVSNHAGTGAEPAPSPTIVQSAPPPTVDGEGSPADSDIPPSPAGERPPHPVPREQRQGTYCEDYETDGCSVDVCPDGCYHALKFRDDAAAEWIGEAVPVISEVLAEHRFLTTVGQCSCPCDSRETPPHFTQSTWREHLAPLIANALAPQPMPAFPRSDFAKGVDAAANIVGEEAQKVWREVLDSPVARHAFDGMNVACRLDSLTQQLRDHANEYSK